MTTEIEVPKGQRQKDYRAAMRSKGFTCKQLWIPVDKVDEVEKLVMDMRRAYHDDDELI